jgi:hypothetical protein
MLTLRAVAQKRRPHMESWRASRAPVGLTFDRANSWERRCEAMTAHLFHHATGSTLHDATRTGCVQRGRRRLAGAPGHTAKNGGAYAYCDAGTTHAVTSAPSGTFPYDATGCMTARTAAQGNQSIVYDARRLPMHIDVGGPTGADGVDNGRRGKVVVRCSHRLRIPTSTSSAVGVAQLTSVMAVMAWSGMHAGETAPTSSPT